MLEVSDLHVSYGQSEVIHGVNFEAKKNEMAWVKPRCLNP